MVRQDIPPAGHTAAPKDFDGAAGSSIREPKSECTDNNPTKHLHNDNFIVQDTATSANNGIQQDPSAGNAISNSSESPVVYTPGQGSSDSEVETEARSSYKPVSTQGVVKTKPPLQLLDGDLQAEQAHKEESQELNRSILASPNEPSARAWKPVEKTVHGAFVDFSRGGRMGVLEKAAEAKKKKLKELMGFANTFKLGTPVPRDIVGIIAKDPEKQRKIPDKSDKIAEEVPRVKELVAKKAEEAVKEGLFTPVEMSFAAAAMQEKGLEASQLQRHQAQPQSESGGAFVVPNNYLDSQELPHLQETTQIALRQEQQQTLRKRQQYLQTLPEAPRQKPMDPRVAAHMSRRQAVQVKVREGIESSDNARLLMRNGLTVDDSSNPAVGRASSSVPTSAPDGPQRLSSSACLASPPTPNGGHGPKSMFFIPSKSHNIDIRTASGEIVHFHPIPRRQEDYSRPSHLYSPIASKSHGNTAFDDKAENSDCNQGEKHGPKNVVVVHSTTAEDNLHVSSLISSSASQGRGKFDDEIAKKTNESTAANDGKREHDDEQSATCFHAKAISKKKLSVRVGHYPLAKVRRLTSSCQIHLATRFEPSDTLTSPEDHFRGVTVLPGGPRFVNRSNSREIMLVTNGSCASNGAGVGRSAPAENEPSAGASLIYRDFPYGAVSFRLEAEGPHGDVRPPTSSRAKLRAAVAALEFRPWDAEGWERVVVVTDLEYVARGATEWIASWVKHRWRSAPRWTKAGMFLGKKIANRDLWEQLQGRVDALHASGTEVAFWLVDRHAGGVLLREAKLAAREAAKSGPMLREYTSIPVVRGGPSPVSGPHSAFRG